MREGLEPTDRIIINGLMRARPGAQVTPVDGKIEPVVAVELTRRSQRMNLSHFFIDRPIFATVLSIFITLIGGVAYFTLPVAQYPEIAPPTIVVTRQLSRRLGRSGQQHRGRRRWSRRSTASRTCST